MFTKEQIETAIKAKAYKWFETDINIVGIRNSSTDRKITNQFDDWITVSLKVDGVWQFYQWSITTEPGIKGAVDFENPKGVARLVPGQYENVYRIDKHNGKYEALCQRNGVVTVYRDANADLTFDENKTDTGSFGINIHKAGQDSIQVDNWSAGCQVFKRAKDFNEFMILCKTVTKLNDNCFTYTLIESKNII